MRKDAVRLSPIKSSFFSCERDLQTLMKILFVENKPYSDYLKRLLVINNPDCLDSTNQEYAKIIKNMSVGKLHQMGYIQFDTRVRFNEHETIKSYLAINFDEFLTNKANERYRDYYIYFDIICHHDAIMLNDYCNRSIKIAGYIDGIIEEYNDRRKKGYGNSQLSGIGNYYFQGSKYKNYDENLSGYCMWYRMVHFSEDWETPESIAYV